ncbi:putative transposase [Trichonephila clavipes]|nr:putative transposase [Trichonephila clavipes]
MGLQSLFMDDNAPCHRTVAAEQLLESEDIERMDWPARSPDLNPIEHVWDFLGRRLAARTLPPVTIRELRLALQDEWAAMPQQLIDTLILSMGRRCETCLASLVYADKPQTLDHFEDNIRRVIADIRPQMLEKVIENWTSRLDYIRASRGSPMPEIILKMRKSIEDEPRSGRPSVSKTAENVVRVRDLVRSDRRLTPPYSPDLSPCDFFLFPKLKNHLKGYHFGTLENIQTAVTDQLKAVPISEFHQCYEEWQKRLQRCVASGGSYFEGDNVEL